jgi:hypothetical protein
MATRQDLNEDLNVGMTEVRRTLEHYHLGEWQEYLLVRRKGCPNSFIVLAHPRDKSDFDEKLIAFHKEQSRKEFMEAEGITEEEMEETRFPKTFQDSER